MKNVSWILAVSVLAVATLLAIVLPLVLPVKEKRPVMSDTVASALYKMTHDFKTIAEENNLHYWITGGTLIGALRHQGLIPWDDDIDIAIKSTDVNLFLRLEGRFKQLGYVYKKPRGYKIVAENMPEPNWIDIFIYVKEGDNYVMEDESSRKCWPKEVFTAESVNNRVLYKFGDDYLYGPGHAIEFLNRAFSKKWNHEGKFQSSHASKSSKRKKIQTWVLKQHEYQPAGKKILTYH